MMMINDHDQDNVQVSEPSSPDTHFDDADLLSSGVPDDVTAQLVAAGQYFCISYILQYYAPSLYPFGSDVTSASFAFN